MRALSKNKNLKQILRKHVFFGHDNETNGDKWRKFDDWKAWKEDEID